MFWNITKVVGYFVLQTPVPSSSSQVDHHLNSNAPGPPKLGSKDPALLMRQQQIHHHINNPDGHLISPSPGDNNHASAQQVMNLR